MGSCSKKRKNVAKLVFLEVGGQFFQTFSLDRGTIVRIRIEYMQAMVHHRLRGIIEVTPVVGAELRHTQ